MLLLLPLLLLSVSSGASAAINDVIKNSDLLILDLNHRTEQPLSGDPGALIKLEFTLRAKGEGGHFLISQTSDHAGFNGTYPTEINVGNNNLYTITVNNLIVPAVKAGTKVSITLKATRVGGQSSGGQSGSPGAAVTELTKTVIFTVGKAVVDDSKPVVTAKDVQNCQVAKNDSSCGNHRWKVEFTAQDSESGLYQVQVRAASRESITLPTEWSYNNYAVGSTEKVTVYADMSCCAAGIVFKAVNVAGVENEAEFFQGQNSAASTGGFTMLFSLIMAFVVSKM